MVETKSRLYLKILRVASLNSKDRASYEILTNRYDEENSKNKIKKTTSN